MRITHAFVSPVPASSDPTLVQGPDWNAPHVTDATIVTGDQLVAIGDFLGIDTRTAACTVVLPSDAGTVTFEDTYASWATHNVTVALPGGYTIAGGTTLVLDEAARVTLICDPAASAWYVKEVVELYPVGRS